MKDKVEEIIERIETTEQLLARQSPKNIGKNLSKYVKLKEKYNKMIQK